MSATRDIHYSDGSVVKDAVICIWDDHSTERRGNWYRAYWCASNEASSGSPVIGYCSSGGSQRTIKATALEALRLYPATPVFRNGKPIKL